MTQIVYYGFEDNVLGHELEPLDSYIKREVLKDSGTNILACPAFKDHNKNVFVVKSTYQYGIEWDGTNIVSPYYNQKCFNDWVICRSIDKAFLSFRPPNISFMSESDSLKMSQEHAYFHDNDITNKCYTICGTYDIGKHLLRPLELVIKFKQPGYVKINEGDALYYVKFHTNEDIILKKFIYSQELFDLTTSQLLVRKYTKNFKDLQWWYDLVSRNNLKKYYLNKIKQELL